MNKTFESKITEKNNLYYGFDIINKKNRNIDYNHNVHMYHKKKQKKNSNWNHTNEIIMVNGMWDTSKDYRLLVAEKSVYLFLRTIEGANLRGTWNKKKATANAKDMISEIQVMYYSYLEPGELAKTPQIKALKEKINYIIEALGSEEWYRQFLGAVNKDEKEKVEEAIAKIKFFLNTILNIDKRMAFGKLNDPIIGIDVKAGEVLSVSKHPKTDKLLVCNVNIGGRAITIVTNDLDVGDGDRVAVAMLPPISFMGITSEGMFLGAGKGVLKDVKGDPGDLPKGIPLEALNEARNFVEDFLK